MFKLPDLPYAYDALEPYIDQETMKLHHLKHHQAYVDKLNQALEGNREFVSLPIYELLRQIDRVPADIVQPVKNHGGGHANHSLFWEIMTGREIIPSTEMTNTIKKHFESFDKFRDLFSSTANQIFGSGWAWLVKDGETLKVISTTNQDSPLMEGMVPILGLDVWEHAYYLKYQNRRAEYIDNWWNLVNWDKVESKIGNNI